MKTFIKNILKQVGLYHPLQSRYRGWINNRKRRSLRSQFQKYKGSGLVCNFCGNSYELFADDLPAAENENALLKYHVIAGYGRNIICPSCLSNARERLVLSVLTEINVQGLRVLHLSPEDKIYKYLRLHANVTTADLTPGFYKAIDKKVKREDATRLSFPDDSFDLLIANHILEHIPDDDAAMCEFYRVLKPGGRAILQVPYSQDLEVTVESDKIQHAAIQSELYGQKDHVRIYAVDDYVSRLRNCGFQVVVHSYESLKRFHKYAIQEEECYFEITKPIS